MGWDGWGRVGVEWSGNGLDGMGFGSGKEGVEVGGWGGVG